MIVLCARAPDCVCFPPSPAALCLLPCAASAAQSRSSPLLFPPPPLLRPRRGPGHRGPAHALLMAPWKPARHSRGLARLLGREGRGGEGEGGLTERNNSARPLSPRLVPASCGLGGAGAGEWGFSSVLYPSRIDPSSRGTVNLGFVIIVGPIGLVTSLCELSTPGAPPRRGWGARHGAQCDAGGTWPAPRGALLPPPPPKTPLAM